MKMSFKRKDIEIMAPVGSYESLRAAIDAGADSVYFGVGQLNMRSRSAANFTLDDLARIVSIARRHNVKTYLAVNTLLYDANDGSGQDRGSVRRDRFGSGGYPLRPVDRP